MAKNDTLTHVPASRYTNAGVKRGASNVEVIVIPTDSGTSPFAIWVITLLAVPPGQQPTSITPSAKSGSNLNTTASSQAKTGMMVYCARHPSNISLGLVNIFLKSEVLMVVPIPNMAMPRSRAVCFKIHLKYSGLKNAITENTIIRIQIYFVMKLLTLFKILIFHPFLFILKQ